MRAITVEHRNDNGETREVPDPIPSDHDVLVRISVAGMNPIDWKLRDLYERPRPFTLGQDFAGTIVGAGKNVREYEHGERVFGIARTHGAYAELTVVSLDDASDPIAKIPDGVGDADAAGLPTPGLTALAAIDRIDITAGTEIVIVGVAGSLGQIATQLAIARGARIVGVGRATSRAHLVSYGVERYIAFDETDRTGVIDELRHLLPDGADAVLDLASNAAEIAAFGETLRPGGIIISTNRALDEAALRGRGLHAENVNLDDSATPLHEGLRRLVKLVESQELRVPLIAVHDFTEAIGTLETLKAGAIDGKIVLTVSA